MIEREETGYTQRQRSEFKLMRKMVVMVTQLTENAGLWFKDFSESN